MSDVIGILGGLVVSIILVIVGTYSIVNGIGDMINFGAALLIGGIIGVIVCVIAIAKS